MILYSVNACDVRIKQRTCSHTTTFLGLQATGSGSKGLYEMHATLVYSEKLPCPVTAPIMSRPVRLTETNPIPLPPPPPPILGGAPAGQRGH